MSALFIQPTPMIPPPVLVTNFRYTVVEFEFHKRIVLRCSFFDANENLISARDVEISGKEYANWGTDDAMLIKTLYGRLDLAPSAPVNRPINMYPKVAVDTSGNSVDFFYALMDQNRQLLPPPGFSRDPGSGGLVDEQGRRPMFFYLAYNVDGNPFVYNPFTGNMPEGCIMDAQGYVRDQQGIHIVIAV